jgi:hypothetical protein
VNGEQVTLALPADAIGGEALFVAVANGKVYAGGYVVNESGVATPGYWLEGSWVSLPLPSGFTLEFGYGIPSIAINGTNVYFALPGTLNASNEIPGYWQNNTWVPLALPLGSTSGQIKSLIVN